MLLHECPTGSDLFANLERHMVEKGLLDQLGNLIVDYKDFLFFLNGYYCLCVSFAMLQFHHVDNVDTN